MKVDVELEPFTPLLRPTYADAHAGAISEVRMEGYEFGHTYVWQGPDVSKLELLNNGRDSRRWKNKKCFITGR